MGRTDACGRWAGCLPWVLVLVSQAACAPVAVDNRSLFAGLTYAPHELPPRADLELQLYAALQLEGVTTYADPHVVAGCYRALNVGFLRSVGNRLSHADRDAGDSAVTWGEAERALADQLPPECSAVTGDDRLLMQYSVAHMAGTLAAFARAAVITPSRDDDVYRAGVLGIQRVANLLDATRAATPSSTVDLPVLALSGGSANGAFTAGFLYELLGARERALAKIEDPRERATLDRNSRFSGLVGTSVGALLTQVLDLYFVRADLPLDSAQRAYLEQCLAHRARPASRTFENPACYEGDPGLTFPSIDLATLGTARPIQACALAAIHHYFSDVEERDLMCVESGPVTRAVGFLGPQQLGLIRFDPMSRTIIDPILRSFTPALLENDTTRIVVAVEVQQNQTLGLDERSCASLKPVAPSSGDQVVTAGGPEYCLSSGVMASAVLPFFARPLRHAYSGFWDGGECGTWFDGGLRSGFPALRALRLVRPAALLTRPPPASGETAPPPPLRVLAIETGRLNALPNKRPATIIDVALNAIGQMAEANTVDELLLAQVMANQRERELAVLRGGRAALCSVEPDCRPDAGTRPPDAGAASNRAVPTPMADDWLVSAVHVPGEVPTGIVADSGYAFDRYVMRGLFTWGRRVAIRRILGYQPDGNVSQERKLATQLGWPSTLAGHVEELAERDYQDAELKRWETAYEKDECREFRAARIAEGRRRVLDPATPECLGLEEPTGTTPHYFTCQPGALDLEAATPAGARVRP